MPYVTDAEAASLDLLVRRLEAATGVQVVPAVVGRSDGYVELPWKAFALGASLSALAVVGADARHPEWVTASTAAMHAIAILGSGATCALLAVFAPPFARLFLRAARADIEVRQYARSMFLDRAIFATRARTGILVFVSLFERRIEVVADTGFAGRVTPDEWSAVIARMTPHLRQHRPFDALRDALVAIEALLIANAFRGAPDITNELPDSTIQERGE